MVLKCFVIHGSVLGTNGQPTCCLVETLYSGSPLKRSPGAVLFLKLLKRYLEMFGHWRPKVFLFAYSCRQVKQSTYRTFLQAFCVLRHSLHRISIGIIAWPDPEVKKELKGILFAWGVYPTKPILLSPLTLCLEHAIWTSPCLARTDIDRSNKQWYLSVC
jgi:hypothetical protein